MKMFVGRCRVSMRLHGVRTLKEKRGVLKPFMHRVRKHFNVAIAETGSQDIADRAEIGFAVVSTAKRHVDSQIEAILADIEKIGEPDIEIIGCEREID